MPFAKIFDAIKLTGLDPWAFARDLNAAIDRLRFANLTPKQRATGLALGEKLLGYMNFKSAPSGLFDRNGILLPIEGLNSQEAIKNRLEWMIDARVQTDLICYVLDRVNSKLPDIRECESRPQKYDRRMQVKINVIANHFTEARSLYPEFVDALLFGQLGDTEAHAVGILPEDRSRCAYLVRSMYVIWTLFDLQIVAFRLWHADRNVMDDGNPRAMTVAAVRIIVDELAEMAKLAKDEFEDGKGIEDADQKLRAFIEKYDLEGIATSASDDVNVDINSKGQVATYLSFLEALLTDMIEAFDNTPKAERYTTIERVRMNGAVFKYRKQPKKSLVDKSDVTTQRFDVSLLTALCLAVMRATDFIASLPIDQSILSLSSGTSTSSSKRSRAQTLLNSHGRTGLNRDLFAIYQVLFMSDAKPNYCDPADRIDDEADQIAGYGGRLPRQNQADANEIIQAIGAGMTETDDGLKFIEEQFNHPASRTRSE